MPVASPGAIYGPLMGFSIGGLELFVLGGPLRTWLSNLPFTVNLMVRSAIYAAIIMAIQLLQDEFIAGRPGISDGDFWSGVVIAAGVSD
jgi:adenylate cyclase